MQSEKETIDPSALQEQLTYNSWWEGRFTFVPEGLMFNINFDELKTPYERMKSAKLAVIPNTIPPDEQKKINEKQEEIFTTNLKYKTQNLTSNFLERFKKSQDKQTLILSEIEVFEKLLFEEKLKLTPGEELNQFNAENRFFSMMGIGYIRQIYKERIVQGNRSFIEVRSHFCRFGMGRNVVEDYLQVEAYFKFLEWVRNYKQRHGELQQMIQETHNQNSPIKDELVLIEKLITDISTHYTYYHIFQLENPDDGHSKAKDDDGFEYEPLKIRFYENIFLKEIERCKQAINMAILNLGHHSEKSSYLNILHSKINGLVRKNHDKRIFYDELKAHYAQRVIHGYYHVQLRAMRDSLEKDYKPFIDPALLFNNTDEKKFIHSILCNYHEQYEELLKHKNHECKTRIYQEKLTTELFGDFKEEYIEQYDYIMQKWVQKSKAGDTMLLNYIL